MATIKKSKGELVARKPERPAGLVEKELDSKFELARQKSKPVEALGGYTTLMYGERKIGKTTLWSNIPRVYFMMFEPGAKALSVYQDPYLRWSQVKKGIRLLAKDSRFDVVVVDIVDKMFRLCEKYVCRKLGIDHVSEADWGKGWSALRDEFESEINLLLMGGKGVVFISHATEREMRVRGGERYDMLTSTLPKTAREIIEGLVDIWAYYGYHGTRRRLWVRGSDHINAGHRLKDHFKLNGNDLEWIDMGDSEESAAKNFVDAFNNRYVPPPTPEPETVTKRIKKLEKRS